MTRVKLADMVMPEMKNIIDACVVMDITDREIFPIARQICDILRVDNTSINSFKSSFATIVVNLITRIKMGCKWFEDLDFTQSYEVTRLAMHLYVLDEMSKF